MKVLIDSDIIVFEYGNATDNEYNRLPWPLVQSRVQGRINKIIEATQADSYQLYLTSTDKSNFRYKVATIKPYKGNRPTEKPFYYDKIRKFLIESRDAIEVFDMEADDALSIAQYKDLENTVIASRDKDLDMVPGLHYNWGAGNQKEKELWCQDELDGKKCFYCQLLIGDQCDNIPGLFGVGKSSTLLDTVNNLTNEYEMYLFVLGHYEKRFGSYAEQFLLENARLLHLLEYENQIWEVPTDGKI